MAQIIQQYPFLKSQYIRLIYKKYSKFRYENQKYIYSGAAIFKNNEMNQIGTLGCFCRDKEGNHYAITSKHVVDEVITENNEIIVKNTPNDKNQEVPKLILTKNKAIDFSELDISILPVKEGKYWCVEQNINCCALSDQNEE